MLGRRCLPRVSRAVLGPRWGPPGGRAAGARAGRSQAGPSAQAPLAVVSVVLPEALPAGTGLGAPWGAAAGPSRVPRPGSPCVSVAGPLRLCSSPADGLQRQRY